MFAHIAYRLMVVTLVSALVIGGGVTGDASARTEATASSVAKHKKKRKAVKCRKSQVPIKLKRRTVGCRSLRAALPAPREGDPRLLLAKTALDDDLAGVRDRRGRRAPSLKKLFRKVGPRAYRKVQAAIPQGLARLDRLATGSPASRAAAAIAARQLPKCAGAPPPTKTDTYRSSSGDESMTATVTLGAVGTLALQLEGGAYRISVAITSDECSHFDAPACPTAAGVVDANDSSTFKVSLTVAKGDTVLMSRSFDYSGQTRMHAEVDEHSELRLIDIDDTRTANIELGGTRQEFGPVNLIYTGIHHARVDMPKGNYTPGLSAVDISLTARGVTVGRSDLGQVGNNIARDLDNDFATLVGTEISNFRSLENAWRTPGECATLVFEPASYDLGRLSKGQTGQLTAHVVAKSDKGTARPGDWTVIGAANGTITPASVAGAAPTFSWVVTDAGPGIKLKGDFEVTSTAGVASGTWEQETEDKPLYRGSVSGTRGDTYIPGECGGGWEFSYSARLADIVGSDQPFPIIDTDGSGPAGGGARGYDETGNGTYTLEPCNGLPACSTSLSLDPTVSHGVVLFDADANTVVVTVDVAPILHGDDCGLPGLTLGGGTFPRSMIGADTITVQLSFNSGPVFGDGTLTLTRDN
jgi:hypothetical protein